MLVASDRSEKNGFIVLKMCEQCYLWLHSADMTWRCSKIPRLIDSRRVSICSNKLSTIAGSKRHRSYYFLISWICFAKKLCQAADTWDYFFQTIQVIWRSMIEIYFILKILNWIPPHMTYALQVLIAISTKLLYSFRKNSSNATIIRGEWFAHILQPLLTQPTFRLSSRSLWKLWLKKIWAMLHYSDRSQTMLSISFKQENEHILFIFFYNFI